MITLLGIIKSGAAYLPLDPEYPVQRLGLMVAGVGPSFIMTTGSIEDALGPGLLSYWEEHAAALSSVGVLPERLLVDDAGFRDIVSGYDDGVIAASERIAPLQPDHLAYVIYTSGSTGTPKGAANSQHGTINHMFWKQNILQLTEEDRILHKTSLSFDVSVWEWILPLITGAQVVVAAPGGHRDPVYLANMINQHAISVIDLVPSMLSIFLNELEGSDVSSLRQIIVGGEALDIAGQTRAFSIVPSAKLLNLYGPTESTITVSYHNCLPDDTGSTPPIGSPIWNTQLYILDLSLIHI